MEVHDCPEEGEKVTKIAGVSIDLETGENFCSYCDQPIENIKSFDSLEEYEEYIE